MTEYRLEITMEARFYEMHKYIKRSFPIKKGKLDIGAYGYPYSKYNTVEIGDMFTTSNAIYDDGIGLKLKFEGEEIIVWLNSFTTVKKGGETSIDPYRKTPTSTPLVHTTFYLFVEK